MIIWFIASLPFWVSGIWFVWSGLSVAARMLADGTGSDGDVVDVGVIELLGVGLLYIATRMCT